MSEHAVALGIDVGGTAFKIGLFDREGAKIAADKHPTPRKGEAGAVLAAIAQAADDLLQHAGLPRESLAGAGLGVPGRVDPDSGVALNCPNLQVLDGVNVVLGLSQRIDTPVLLANDAFCATLGELRYGAGQGANNLLLLTLGTGVGGGVVINNKAVRGPRQLMGEIGHMTILPGGRRCGCGNFGCLEAMVAKEAMIEHALRRLAAGRESLIDTLTGGEDAKISPKIISQAAGEGDAVALEVIAETGTYVGIAICNAVLMVDPDRVLVGGGIAAAGEPLFGAIRRTVKHRACISQFDPEKILPTSLGNEAGVYGAAAMVWEE
ncbi:MAG: ROK family protein [candidate division WS1 bacterium]|jgi:glucokinase|nr:ROK family protein [candidate division WS1 bacterium]